MLGLAIVAAALFMAPSMDQHAIAAFTPQTAVAEYGYINSNVIGTGNLENADEESIKNYTSIEYDEIFVDVNDLVNEGDQIAKVNSDSVSQRIEAIQAEIESIDTQKYADSQSDDKTIYAPVEGRIKLLYAKKDKAVKDIMASNGMLAQISVDGLMAVEFDTDKELKIGLEVTVKTDDGSERDGTVDEKNGSRYTVSFDDKNVLIGELVIVYSHNDGFEFGRGNAYVNEPLNITATDGIIDKLYIDHEKYVYKDDKVILLSNLPKNSEYSHLQTTRNELVSELNYLIKLSETYIVTADFSGTISQLLITEKDGTATLPSSNQGVTGNGYGAQSATGQTAASQGQDAAMGQAGAQGAIAAESTKTTILSYHPKDMVELSVKIDELDILKVKTGQKAKVVFDAISGQEYEAVISSIEQKGIVTNGVAKYKAVLDLPYSADMRVGMNATATITCEENGNALLIPLSALQEYGDKIFVYTSYDEANNKLGGNREVKTGLSNGSSVEIIEGLKEGDSVYYGNVDKKAGDIEDIVNDVNAMAENTSIQHNLDNAPVGDGGGNGD